MTDLTNESEVSHYTCDSTRGDNMKKDTAGDGGYCMDGSLGFDESCEAASSGYCVCPKDHGKCAEWCGDSPQLSAEQNEGE